MMPIMDKMFSMQVPPSNSKIEVPVTSTGNARRGKLCCWNGKHGAQSIGHPEREREEKQHHHQPKGRERDSSRKTTKKQREEEDGHEGG